MKDVTPYVTEKNLSNYIPIPECGCWLWLGRQSNKGYGICRGRGNDCASAHRVFFTAHSGCIPENMSVLHKCDTPLCVNPDHLFLGTHAENMADQKKKNRHAFGEQNSHAKLTKRDVLHLREIQLHGKSNFKIAAKKYGVSFHAIRDAVVGRSWKHLSGATHPELIRRYRVRSEAHCFAKAHNGLKFELRRSR